MLFQPNPQWHHAGAGSISQEHSSCFLCKIMPVIRLVLCIQTSTGWWVKEHLPSNLCWVCCCAPKQALLDHFRGQPCALWSEFLQIPTGILPGWLGSVWVASAVQPGSASHQVVHALMPGSHYVKPRCICLKADSCLSSGLCLLSQQHFVGGGGVLQPVGSC